VSQREARHWFPADELLLLVGVACLYNFLAAGWLVLTEPHVINYTEGISLLAALRVQDGLSLYPDLSTPPFVYLAYPPVYPAVSAAFVGVLGTGLWPLRLLTLLAELAAGVLVYRLLRRSGVSRLRALALGLVALGLLSVHKFHGLARLDPFLVAVELGCVELALAARARPTWTRLGGLGALAVVAMLTKPTAAITLAVLGGHALLGARGQPGPARAAARRVLGAFVAAGVVYAAFVAILQATSDGRFWEHTIVLQAASGVEPRWRNYGPLAVFWFEVRWPIVAMGGIIALTRPGLLAAFATVQLVWLALATRKFGADANYYLLPMLAMLVACGRAFAPDARPVHPALARLPGHVPWRAVVLPVVLVAALVGQALRITQLRPFDRPCLVFFNRQLRNEQTAAFRERLVQAVASAPPGPVLVEEPYFAVINGRDYIMSDPFHLMLLHKKGLYDLAPVLAEIRQARVAITGGRLTRLAGDVLRPALVDMVFVERGEAMDYADWLILLRRDRVGEPPPPVR
jgi:4-amino-4-deoxy-L-arabinose transferase-like glycosyltransferase